MKAYLNAGREATAFMKYHKGEPACGRFLMILQVAKRIANVRFTAGREATANVRFTNAFCKTGLTICGKFHLNEGDAERVENRNVHLTK